jgi:hypothetical protein
MDHAEKGVVMRQWQIGAWTAAVLRTSSVLPTRRFAKALGATLPLVGRVREATEQGEVAETGWGWRRLALSLADASTFRHPHPALRATLPTRGRVKPAASSAP